MHNVPFERSRLGVAGGVWFQTLTGCGGMEAGFPLPTLKFPRISGVAECAPMARYVAVLPCHVFIFQGLSDLSARTWIFVWRVPSDSSQNVSGASPNAPLRLLGSPFQQTMTSLFHRVKLAALQLYISYPPPWLYYISTCCAGVCLLVTRFNTAAVRILTSPVGDDSVKRPKQFAQVRIRKESTM